MIPISSHRNVFRTRNIGAHGIVLVATAVSLVTTFAASAGAQVVERRPRNRAVSVEDDGPATTFVGGALTYAAPQGDFKDNVNGAFGITGNLVHAFDTDGIVSLRAELGYLIYGQTTNRQPLGGGALGLVTVDVTTSNNIVFGGLGLQLTAPTSVVRPYITGSIGFSYFFTESSVAGSQNVNGAFAQSENFSDNGFTTLWGGGLYIPLRHGSRPISLDLGAQMHKNPDIQYLTKNSIQIVDANTPPVITAVRSSADFVTFRLGVSFGVR